MTPESLEIIQSLGFALNSAIHKVHKIKLEILGITNSNKQDHWVVRERFGKEVISIGVCDLCLMKDSYTV